MFTVPQLVMLCVSIVLKMAKRISNRKSSFNQKHTVVSFLSQKLLFMSGNSGKWQMLHDVVMSNVMGQYK